MGGVCGTCPCFTTQQIVLNTSGQINLPIANQGSDPGCPTIAQYNDAGFSTPFLFYKFELSSDGFYRLTYNFSNNVTPGSIVWRFSLNGEVLDLQDSSVFGPIASRVATGVSRGQFYFEINNIPPATNSIAFCGKLSTLIQNSTLLTICANASIRSGTIIGGVPSPINPCSPAIKGLALGTPDGKQICSFTYSVTEQSTLECPSCITSQVKNYTFYCQDLQLATVMKGTGCTFVDKVMSLDLDVSAFVQYALLRTVLSQQLFGCFDIQFLRQRYYQNFLKELQKSKFSYYLMFLEAPYTVKNYWQFFKK